MKTTSATVFLIGATLLLGYTLADKPTPGPTYQAVEPVEAIVMTPEPTVEIAPIATTSPVVTPIKTVTPTVSVSPKPVVKKTEPIPSPVVVAKTYTVEGIYAEWSPYVVRVRCELLDQNGNKTNYTDGSGFLIKVESRQQLGVLTNTHLLRRDGESYTYCDVTFPGNGEVYRVEKKSFLFSSSLSERAGMTLPNPSSYVQNLYSAMNGGNGEKNCKDLKNGDKIVLLGYPKDKPKTSVSYSTGTIIDYSSPYYEADAPIVPGYSGGVAISLKENCDIGIPTFAKLNDPTKSLIFDITKP